jgi:hypothetical protein
MRAVRDDEKDKGEEEEDAKSGRRGNEKRGLV